MTHADLVQRAALWLRNTRRCLLVSTRQLAIAAEQPDALGWKATGFSVLIECKASRSDYARDADKPHRLHASLGMGNERYYLTPPRLLEAHNIPAPWGLLECWQGRIVQKKAAVWVPDKNIAEELKHALACATRCPQEFPIALTAGCLAGCGL